MIRGVLSGLSARTSRLPTLSLDQIARAQPSIGPSRPVLGVRLVTGRGPEVKHRHQAASVHPAANPRHHPREESRSYGGAGKTCSSYRSQPPSQAAAQHCPHAARTHSTPHPISCPSPVCRQQRREPHDPLPRGEPTTASLAPRGRLPVAVPRAPQNASDSSDSTSFEIGSDPVKPFCPIKQSNALGLAIPFDRLITQPRRCNGGLAT
jgi:hypothetical protein